VAFYSYSFFLILKICRNRARFRRNQTFKAILKGVNATAIGLVGAACIILWESAISGAADAIVFSVAITLAVAFGVQAPICIFVGGVIGAILSPDALNLGQQPYCVDQGFAFLDVEQ
jgi:chromate transporter